MHAYVVVSLLTGARTEELRALTWSHLDLEGDASGLPPTPPSIQLWRSVRAGGETKTKRSRRTLELPALCVDALREHRQRQVAQRVRMGQQWVDNDLVFATRYGTELDAANVRRAFRTVAAAAALVSHLCPDLVPKLGGWNPATLTGLAGWSTLVARAHRGNSPSQPVRPNAKPWEHLGDLDAVRKQLRLRLG